MGVVPMRSHDKMQRPQTVPSPSISQPKPIVKCQQTPTVQPWQPVQPCLCPCQQQERRLYRPVSESNLNFSDALQTISRDILNISMKCLHWISEVVSTTGNLLPDTIVQLS